MARPTKLPPELEQGYWNKVGKSATRRTMRNYYFETEALSILMKNGIENFKFLYDPDKENKGLGRSFYKKTIISELGRLLSDEDLLFCAREICQNQPNTIDAIGYIRRTRQRCGSRNEIYNHSRIAAEK